MSPFNKQKKEGTELEINMEWSKDTNTLIYLSNAWGRHSTNTMEIEEGQLQFIRIVALPWK